LYVVYFRLIFIEDETKFVHILSVVLFLARNISRKLYAIFVLRRIIFQVTC
jgi:hypothetical protein